MGHKKDDQETGTDAGVKGYQTPSAEEMQEANATGARNNEQGRAAFITGSTTGGGSNYGQGSSQLDSESYRQGAETTTGSNYDNEAAGLGRSDIGTGDEGSSSSAADAIQAGASTDTSSSSREAAHDEAFQANRNARAQGVAKAERPKEGDHGEIGLGQDSGLSQENSSAGNLGQSGNRDHLSGKAGQ